MLHSIGSTWGVTLATIAATYVLTPFVIHTLGREGYGAWTLIASITGYFSLLALGVPMACVRYLAQHVAERDTSRMNAAIGSCAALYLAIGAAALVIGAALAPLLATFYDIPAELHAEALLAFALMVVQVSAGFIGFLPEGIMFAHHDFVVRNVVKAAGVMLRLALTLGLLRLQPSLLALASVQLACLAFDFGVSCAIVRRRYPAVRISLRDFDWSMVRRIFSFSAYVLLLNAGARLSFETDALVIGAVLGVGVIPFFVIANSLVIYLMEFIVGIAAVVSPMATKLHTEGRTDELRAMFLKWSKVALSLTMMAGLFLVVLGPRFIGWWIDPSFEGPSGGVLQVLTASALLFLPVRGVALPILMGIGKPRTPAVLFAAAGIANVLLSVALAEPLGLVGVAIGTAVPNGVFAVVILVIACRELNTSVAAWVGYVVPRAALGAMPVLALLLWFRVGVRVESIVGLAGAGAAMVLLFALTWIFFVYRNDPYVDLRGGLVRLRAGVRA